MTRFQIIILSILALMATCIMSMLVCSFGLILVLNPDSNSAVSSAPQAIPLPPSISHPSNAPAARTPAPTWVLPPPRALLSPTAINTRVVADTPTVTSTPGQTLLSTPQTVSVQRSNPVYDYTVIEEGEASTVFVFTSTSKPRLIIDRNNFVNIATINTALTRLSLPQVNYPVPKLTSIPGIASDTGIFYWDEYLFGSLTVWSGLCQDSILGNYDCIWKVSITNQKSFIPTSTPTIEAPPIAFPSHDDDRRASFGGEDGSGSSSSSGGCCKYCSKGKPCGDTCISRSYTCHKPAGCACWASGSN